VRLAVRKVRVLLADDHRIVREGLRLVITAQPDMEVIAEADNGRVAASLSLRLQPDIVVMDVSMPEMNGLRATERLAELCPSTRVLMLTRHSDGGYVQPLLEAGARGYVLKQSASEELLRAIRAVAAGFTYLDPAVTEPALSGVCGRGSGHPGKAGKRLSRREEEVLRLIVRGLLNREVADRLSISVKTVETHKVNGMGKLGLTSRVDIIEYAILHGWLENN
jgi:DNA-binding NarL/FixJ family response regulator